MSAANKFVGCAIINRQPVTILDMAIGKYNMPEKASQFIFLGWHHDWVYGSGQYF